MYSKFENPGISKLLLAIDMHNKRFNINQSMTLLMCQRYLANGKYPSTNWGHLIITYYYEPIHDCNNVMIILLMFGSMIIEHQSL